MQFSFAFPGETHSFMSWEPEKQKPLSLPPRASGKCGLACKPGGATLQGSGGQTNVPCSGKPQFSAANS